MASEKASKQDLQKKVVRLKEKIGAVNKRLDQQARAYEKVRKRVKSLRKYDALQEQVLTLNGRLDELSGKADSEAFDALSQESLEQGRQIEELTREIQALRKGLSQQSDQGTSIAARTQELEAYAADLTQARREQQGKLKKLGEDAAGLQEQNSRINKLAAELDERTRALEAASQQLVRHDESYSTELQTSEQSLEELRNRFTSLSDEVSELQGHFQSVEKQISTLDADQEQSRSQLDSLFKRADALETQTASHDERLQDFARQFTSLSESVQGLLALEPDRRFADIDLQSDALRESLGEHRNRLAALEQGGEALAGRLSKSIEDTEALAGRVQAQGSNGEKLEEALQDQSVQLSGQRHGLQELSRDLAIAREQQNAETEELERRVRQRSVLGLILLLLTAGLAGFLFLKPHMTQAEPLITEQAEPLAVEPQATVELKGLQQEVAELRSELKRLDRSIVAINQSVERVDAGVDPELPGQLAALAGTVETLSHERLEQQRQSAGLLAGQEQLSAEIKAIAADAKELERQLAQSAALEGLAEYGKSRRWANAQQLGFYTLQLTGAYQRESLARFIRQHGIESDSAIYNTEYRGRKWHVLFYGTFESVSEAQAAARKLPEALAQHKPWVRRIPGTGELFPL